jgi:hypothetical protein
MKACLLDLGYVMNQYVLLLHLKNRLKPNDQLIDHRSGRFSSEVSIRVTGSQEH